VLYIGINNTYMYMPRGRPRKTASHEQLPHLESLESNKVSVNASVTGRVLEDIENLRIVGESKGISEMNDSELCMAVWRGIIREYLVEGKHVSMILKASELLAKAAGCLYGGGNIKGIGDESPIFLDDLGDTE
jgi:hypothetical protein